jgi:uncharacterized lipoprotein YmbA
MGCVNTAPQPESYYYILDDTQQNAPQNEILARTTTQVRVLPVRVPDYLRQPNLVLKLSNHQIKIANYHFWAEDLSQSIQRVLVNELNNKGTSVNYTQRCISCDELAIVLDHFYPTEQGEVVLSGTYEITSKAQTTVTKRFSLTQSLTEGGYDEAVASMRALLTDLAGQIK